MRIDCDDGSVSGSGFVRNTGYYINGRYYSRPAFMEGVPPPHDGVRLAGGEGGGGVSGGGVSGGGIIRRRSSSFQDNVGYIGYLTDGDNSSSVEDIVERRRRELLNTDGAISFSDCVLVFVVIVAIVYVLLMFGLRVFVAPGVVS